ncbi:TonB-dependent receptor [Maricurvus nonylphenolicus]|uniref:TonB-dependent receptor n=1 Tax=Maricurvus nonylphenolicus TaxID=1008307 RepID=UPI0036F23126
MTWGLYRGLTQLAFGSVVLGTGLHGYASAPEKSDVTEERVVEEILVEAQKRPQASVDVPLAVNAFSGTQLDDLGVANLEQLSDFVPGVNIQQQSVTTTGFAIRGITSDQASATNRPRVSVFQNGVDISRSRGSNIALYDIERVEVLKGPQATLFGSGAEVGAISIHQQRALQENSAELTFGVGSKNNQEFTSVFNTVLNENWASRLALHYKSRDGYIDNPAGGDLNSIDRQALRWSLAYEGEGSRWDLIVNYQNDNPAGTAFSSFYFPEPDAYEESHLDQGRDLGIDRELWDITLEGQIDLNSQWQLTSITSYRDFDAQEIFDADGMSLPVLLFEDRVVHRQFSQEVRFNYDDGDRWQGFVGVNYHQEEGYQKITQQFHEGYLLLLPTVQAFLFTPTAPFDESLLLNPPPLFGPGAPLADFSGIPLNPALRESQTRDGNNSMFDLFADATYSFADQWELTMGLRASYERIKSQITTPEPESPGGIAVATGACGNGFLNQPLCNDSGDLISRRLTQKDNFWGMAGRLVLSYRPTEDTHTYLSYARGRRPNTLDFNNFSAVNNLDDETVDSVEWGIKYRSDDQRLSADGAVFYHRYTSFVTQQPGNTPVASFDDNGKATTTGVELSGHYQLHAKWRMLANVAYVDARIDDDSDFALADHRFRLAPLWSGSLGVEYESTLADVGDWRVGLIYSFQSEVYFEDDNDSNLGNNRQGSYGLCQLNASLTSLNQRWRTDLRVTNLLDKEYLLDAGNTGGLFGMPTYVAGPPRMVEAKLSYAF